MRAEPGKADGQRQGLVGDLAEQMGESGIETRQRHQQGAAINDDAAKHALVEWK